MRNMTKTVKIDNLDVKYFLEGEGDPMVLVHGWASNINEWDIIKDELKKRFTIYYFNLPGHGNTDEWNKDYSIENYSKFLYDFITKLGLDNITLLGQSMGSSIIIDFVLKYGHQIKIKKVILSSLVISSPSIFSKIATKILKKYHFMNYTVGFVHNIVGDLKDNVYYQNFFMKFVCLKDSIYYKKIILSSKEGLRQVSKEAYVGCLISILNFNSQNILQKIFNESGFLLIYGKNDRLTHYKKFNNGGNSNIHILENSAHSPTREQKMEFFNILDNAMSVK